MAISKGEAKADSVDKPSSERRVSVLLPVFQAERTVEEAVESILAQSFDDFELLALDDGSTDSSVRLLEALAARDERITVFRHAHVGLVRRLNEGIRLARGSFIARMDADDVCYPERLEKQIAFLDSHPDCVAVGTGALLVDSERMRIRPLEQADGHDEIESRFMRGDGGALLHASAMYRTDTLREIGGYTERLDGGEDLDLHLRLAETGRLANLDDCLFEYRQSLDGVCGAHRLQVRRNQDAAIRSAFRRRGLDPANVPARSQLEPNPAPEDIWAKWASWALAAGFEATARKYAMLSFGAAPMRHWKLPVRAWLRVEPHLWRRIADAFGLPTRQDRPAIQVAPSSTRAPAHGSKEPAVTVLMRVRNDATFLRDTVDSILDQTFADFEFLIVDDASSDSSPEILAGYHDVRMRLLANPEPLGLARSLNRGIGLARGRYIARIDPGDLSLPDRLRRQVDVLDAETGCAMVATHVERIDALGLQVGIAAAPGDRALRRRLLRENCIVPGSVTLRRSILDGVGLYDEEMSDEQDYDLWLRVSEDHLIRVIPSALHCSRQPQQDIGAFGSEQRRRCEDALRDQVRDSRVSRLLHDFDERRISLGRATDLIASLGREEEIGRLEQRASNGTIERLASKMRRSSGWCRWIWVPALRRRIRACLSEHRSSNPPRERTKSSLRSMIDPAG